MDKIVLTESGRWYKYVGDSTHDVPETGQESVTRQDKTEHIQNQKGEEGHEHN